MNRELSEKIPDEIFQLVESFRKFIREQKAYRDQKFDVDPILEVDREAEEFMLAFQRVSVDSETNSKLIQQIKNDTVRLLRHAELAYSLLRPYLANNPAIQQTPTHINQHQNQTFAPTNCEERIEEHVLTRSSQYFAELADQFESRLKAYGEQIKELKMSLDSVIKTYNADELFKWLKKQHETLGEIAAKVYMTHERIIEKKSELDRSSTYLVTNNQTKTNSFTNTM